MYVILIFAVSKYIFIGSMNLYNRLSYFYMIILHNNYTSNIKTDYRMQVELVAWTLLWFISSKYLLLLWLQIWSYFGLFNLPLRYFLLQYLSLFMSEIIFFDFYYKAVKCKCCHIVKIAVRCFVRENVLLKMNKLILQNITNKLPRPLFFCTTCNDSNLPSR